MVFSRGLYRIEYLPDCLRYLLVILAPLSLFYRRYLGYAGLVGRKLFGR